MTKQELKKVFGWDSYLDLFNWLHENGHSTKESISLIGPVQEHEDRARPEYVFELANVKALAFDEIYDRLPLKASIAIVQDMVEEVGKFSSYSTNDIHTFLSNLPTRAK